jgi:hypothetical protein
MRRIALITLAALISLQGCASLSHEKEACGMFAAYPQLAAPPENVEQLYAIRGFGKPRRGYHEHWYKLGDDSLAACRHLRGERSGCATEATRFVRTINGWEMGTAEIIVCASDARPLSPSNAVARR